MEIESKRSITVRRSHVESIASSNGGCRSASDSDPRSENGHSRSFPADPQTNVRSNQRSMELLRAAPPEELSDERVEKVNESNDGKG